MREVILGGFFNLNYRRSSIHYRPKQCFGEIIDLDFRGKENRVVGRKSVGSKTVVPLSGLILEPCLWVRLQNSEVWEVMHVCAHVGLGADVIIPLLVKADTVDTTNLERGEEVDHLETSGEDDDIELLMDTTLTCDSSCINAGDALWCKTEVLGVE